MQKEVQTQAVVIEWEYLRSKPLGPVYAQNGCTW